MSADVSIQALQDEIAALKQRIATFEQSLGGVDAPPVAADLFPLLLASVQDYAILMLDPTGHVMTWNTGAARIKGYAAADILGAHFSRFYPPEGIAAGRPARELATALQEGRFEEEDWRVRKDGSRFWANVVLTPMYDQAGTLRGFAKITRDMTERKQAEELRRESITQAETIRAQYATLQELSTPIIPIMDGVLVVPLVGTIDHRRAHDLVETLLAGIVQHHATAAILDITGVRIVDTHVARAVVQAAQATRLLGTQLVITGIRPEIAQTFVSLGVTLAGIVTSSTLQAGIAYVTRQR